MILNRLPLGGLLLMTLLGCGVDPDEHAALAKERDQLAAALAERDEDLRKAEALIADLQETDQGLFLKLRDAEVSGKPETVVRTADTFLSRWPSSPLAAQVRSARSAARELVAQAQYHEAETVIASGDESKAEEILRSLADTYPATASGKKARREIPSLSRRVKMAQEKREREMEERRQRELRAAADVELTAFSWSSNHGYATVEGMVRNLRGEGLERVQAVAIFSDRSGAFISSADALVDYQPLLKGQASPFKVMARYNPAMQTCRVEFKQLMGGSLETFHSWREK